MIRLLLAPLAVCAAIALAAAPAGAAVPAGEGTLPDIDVRARDSGPLTATERDARTSLRRTLGRQGRVSTDRISGGARLVARTDGFLTGVRSASPAVIALDYVRSHPDVFGLDEPALHRLRLTRSYRSPDGVTHLAWEQTYRGIAAYDNVLLANVDRAGRLVNVGGSAVGELRVSSVAPDLQAGAALAVARRRIGGALIAPRARTGRGPERPTSFAGGDSARLTLFDDGETTRLAWRVLATGEHEYGYELVVDADGGRLLSRRALTDFAAARVYANFPGAASGGTPQDVVLDLAWIGDTDGNRRLRGNNAHAYVDTDTDDATAGDVEVPADAGGDWLYPVTHFNIPEQPCGASCTWNAGSPGTRTTNRRQATTQLFWFVNTFHDHLRAAPIGFTHEAGGFEQIDADGADPGLGGDRVRAETDNYLNPDPPAANSINNASMTTLPDGNAPRLQAFMWGPTAQEPGIPSVNSADAADIVYHEYAHGLTNRSVGSGVSLDADQSRALGEGWSDWYALDYLEEEGLRPDGPAAGELTLGDYVLPGGLRTQGADCPVAIVDAACPGTPGAGAGGYTLGDMGKVAGSGFEVHADGEIWLQTLWDLRAQFGVANARRLITGGLRLAPNNPSFLEARDAILLADRIAGGPNYGALWAIFAARGMGFGASTTSSAATTASESFDPPPRLAHKATTVTDPAPGGDGDDVAEPGETIQVTEELFNPFATDAFGVAGTLTSSTPGVTIGQGATQWLPKIGAGLTRTSSPPLQVTIPAGADCDSAVKLDLEVSTDSTDQGGPFSVGLRVPIGSRPSTDVPKPIPTSLDGVQSTLTFVGRGPVEGLEVVIPRLAHTWVGDLVVTLTSPSGTVVKLMDRPGAGADGAAGQDFVDLVLDDDAATAIEDIPATNPPGGYTGRFRPDESLSAFDGEDRQGAWTLTVVDGFPTFDAGTLYDWSLRPSEEAPCNRAPVAAPDSYAVAGGQPLRGTSVLANDSDPDGDPITAVKTGDPAHGSVALAADGTFVYTPQPGYRGLDAFSYRAQDPEPRASAPATVTISVGNVPPTAVADAYATREGVALGGFSVLANDSDPNGDPLTAALAVGPSNGRLTLAGDGTFVYFPDPGFSGRDAFVYSASDGSASSPPALVVITVVPGAVEQPIRFPAKLQILRAGVDDGRLDVFARITGRASGRVRVEYHSSGRRTRFSVPVDDGRVSFKRRLPAAQRGKSTGIVTLTYDGNERVRPDELRLRAANGKARLRRTTTRIDAAGRLRVAGTISSRARGVVRVRLGYDGGGGRAEFLYYRARIRDGRWSLTETLPRAARAGGQLSIQFTGYERRRIRGEQLAKQVLP